MPVYLIIAIVLLVASFAITALMAKKPVSQKPAVITDFEFPQAAEGTPQSVIFGDCWSPDYQILWYGNFRTSDIVATSGGKKG